MIIHVRKWLERAKFIVLFLVCTFVLYHMLHLAAGWMMPHHRFGEPSGQAVKVNAEEEAAVNNTTFGERLRFFYWYGE